MPAPLQRSTLPAIRKPMPTALIKPLEVAGTARPAGGTRIGIVRGVKKALIGKVLAGDGGGSSEMIFRGIQ